MDDQIRHIVFVNAHFCPFLAIFALQIPHFSPVFAIFDALSHQNIANHPPSFLRMRVQAPLRPSEGHRPSRRPVAPNYAMGWTFYAPKWPRIGQNRSKTLENRPKLSKFGPNCSKISPKAVHFPNWSKIGPKSVENGPKWSQMGQNRYKSVQNGPKRSLGEF